MAFKKGEGGRPKGVPNKSTGEIAARCKALIESPDYQADFRQRLAEGKLPPALEAMTWHYAYGKPVERHEIGGQDGAQIPITVIHKHVTA